jgi:hypothetical protein
MKIIEKRKQLVEMTLSVVAGIAVEITFARKNLVTISWVGENENAFIKLQKYFKGVLHDYEYDKEIDFSICELTLE